MLTKRYKTGITGKHSVVYDINQKNDTRISSCVFPNMVAHDINGVNNTGITFCVLPYLVAYDNRV